MGPQHFNSIQLTADAHNCFDKTLLYQVRRGHSSVVERSPGEREDHGSNPGLGNRYVRPEAALMYTP